MIWSGNLLLDFASIVVLGFGPHAHIFLSHDFELWDPDSQIGPSRVIVCWTLSAIIIGSRFHGTHDHIYLTDWLSQIGRLGRELLGLVSTVIPSSVYRGTHNHIFLSHDSGSQTTALWQHNLEVNCCWSSPAQLFLDFWSHRDSWPNFCLLFRVSSSTSGTVCLSE
jgi:hypothetical protein